MRVRLSYSVELEEVPEAMSELIDNELWIDLKMLRNIGKAVEASHEDPSISHQLKSIDVRALGAKKRLSECESILEG